MQLCIAQHSSLKLRRGVSRVKTQMLEIENDRLIALICVFISEQNWKQFCVLEDSVSKKDNENALRKWKFVCPLAPNMGKKADSGVHLS